MHVHSGRGPAAPPRVLVVEDDPDIRAVVVLQLREQGYDVLITESGDEGLELALTSRPALVLLDLLLPGLDGYTVCREIRARSEVPVIVLSGRSREQDRVRALELGADVYLTKPVGPAELVAAVAAALRRPELSGHDEEPVLRVGELEIDLAGRRVHVSGRAVRLTPTEFSLLVELARHPGRVLTQQELLQRVWGPTYQGQSDYLYVYTHRLRQKLEADPDHPVYLVTEPGVGYALRPPD